MTVENDRDATDDDEASTGFSEKLNRLRDVAAHVRECNPTRAS